MEKVPDEPRLSLWVQVDPLRYWTQSRPPVEFQRLPLLTLVTLVSRMALLYQRVVPSRK